MRAPEHAKAPFIAPILIQFLFWLVSQEVGRTECPMHPELPPLDCSCPILCVPPNPDAGNSFAIILGISCGPKWHTLRGCGWAAVPSRPLACHPPSSGQHCRAECATSAPQPSPEPVLRAATSPTSHCLGHSAPTSGHCQTHKRTGAWPGSWEAAPLLRPCQSRQCVPSAKITRRESFFLLLPECRPISIFKITIGEIHLISHFKGKLFWGEKKS